MTRSELKSFIKEFIKFNREQLITGDVLQNVLLTMLTNMLLIAESGSNFLVQFSADAANWHATEAGTDQYMRISNDGGTTWGGSQYLPSYLYSLLTDSVPESGNTLKKLNDKIEANTTGIIYVNTALGNATPDQLQNLHDLIALMEANNETLEPLLTGKLDTSIYNTFLAQYAIDMEYKADKYHVHHMAQIDGLVSALAGKAPMGHQHTPEQVESWGIVTAADLTFGRL